MLIGLLSQSRALALALFCGLLVSTPVLAQKEATVWLFGVNAGWDFSRGAPTIVTGSAMRTGLATAVMSDAQTGELQCYSNGEQVWNRRHQPMPHGQGLSGFFNITQGALLIPVPAQPRQYYLFVLGPAADLASTLSYSRLDMDLDNGLGDVVAAEKNRPLVGAFTEQLTAIRHANGRDYWVLVHEWPGAFFQVFLADPSGIRLAHRVAMGPTLRGADYHLAREGFLRASPDGRRLAYGTYSREVPLMLFDLDAATGQISHPLALGQLLDGAGVAFSPDNTKLYAQDFRLFNRERGERNIVIQYDLQAGDDAAIAASGQSVVAGNPSTTISAQAQSSSGHYAWQLGLDGRLYGASGYEDSTTTAGLDYLYVIPYPNRRGYACGIRYQAVDFRPGRASGGLPNFLQHYFNGLEASPEPASPCEPTAIQVFPNPASESFRVQLVGGCPAPYRLSVFDAVGRRVLTRSVTQTAAETPVSIAALAAGVYWVEVQVGVSLVSRHQLIKI